VVVKHGEVISESLDRRVRLVVGRILFNYVLESNDSICFFDHTFARVVDALFAVIRNVWG
jgi:hypothetical protein